MREKEFLAALKKMQATLSKKFHFLAIRAGIKTDRKALVEDLISWTVLEALVNSLKNAYMHISCEQLIRIKASNVWAEFMKKRDTSFTNYNPSFLQLDWK